METNERKNNALKGVKEFAQKQRADALRETERQVRELNAYVDKIRGFAPRIKDILDIARTMYENRVYIGKPQKATIGYESEFVTNGITHRLGFYVDVKRTFEHFNEAACFPYAIGIEGGGCSGCGLEVNENGEIVRGISELKKLKEFVFEFDAFESEFYNYAESL